MFILVRVSSFFSHLLTESLIFNFAPFAYPPVALYVTRFLLFIFIRRAKIELEIESIIVISAS